jgi:chemosensory pili system protein ChpA (sensor histidine kinase/response regulator)
MDAELVSASIQKLQGKHILIVEDDAPLLRLLARRFTGYGIHVSLAPSGTKALSEIEQHTPDIILLDVELLDMSGLDFATLVRQHDHTNTVPILFMSGGVDHEEDCLKTPRADFIWKPFALSDLFTRLCKLVL